MVSDQYWFNFLIKSCHLFCTIPNYLGKFNCIKKSIGYLHSWKRFLLFWIDWVHRFFYQEKTENPSSSVKKRLSEIQHTWQKTKDQRPATKLAEIVGTIPMQLFDMYSLSLSLSHARTHTHSHNGVHVYKCNLLYNRTISWWVLETGKNSYPRIPGKVMLYYIYLVCTMSVVGLKTSCCLLAIRVYTLLSIGRWELLVRVEMFITCFIQTKCLYELLYCISQCPLKKYKW